MLESRPLDPELLIRIQVQTSILSLAAPSSVSELCSKHMRPSHKNPCSMKHVGVSGKSPNFCTI